MKYVFGPVPSRRLGRSLGVNNIPPKHCSYSCIYCQLGRTSNLTVNRRTFYPWRDIVKEVISAVRNIGEENIDYITFVPDGEPTLDINLGLELREIGNSVNIPLAVLTNGSLLSRLDVRNDLQEANLVSIKVDAVDMEVFRKINRPHRSLRLDTVLEGIRDFSKEYKGKIITETMLIENVNDKLEEIENIALFIKSINPHKAYIAIPTRPPAEKWVRPAREKTILRAYTAFCRHLGEGKVELLVGYEGPGFKVIKDPVESILAITSVHPMRLDYAYSFLEKHGLSPEGIIRKLAREGKIIIINYRGHKFVMRKIVSR